MTVSLDFMAWHVDVVKSCGIDQHLYEHWSPLWYEASRLKFPLGSWLGHTQIRGSRLYKDLFPSHYPKVVHCGPIPVLAKADFHSWSWGLRSYD